MPPSRGRSALLLLSLLVLLVFFYFFLVDSSSLEAPDRKVWKYAGTTIAVVVSLLAFQYLAASEKKGNASKIKKIPKPGFTKLELEFIEMIKKFTPRYILEGKLQDIDVNANGFFITAQNRTSTTLYSLVMYASQFSNLDAFSLLVDNGADPRWENNNGSTVMNFFYKRKQLDMAKLSLNVIPVEERPVFLDRPITEGWPIKEVFPRITLLQWLENNDVDIRQGLFDIESQEPNFGQPEESFLELIESKSATVSDLAAKIESVNVNARKYYVNKKGNISHTNFSLLMFCSHHDNSNALRLLLEKGADPFWRNNKGATVLQFCAKRGQVEMAKICLNHVAQERREEFVNQENHIGWTPLHSSVRNKWIFFSDWLLNNKADPNKAMYNSNWSPMHDAELGKSVKIKEKLLAKGGRLDVRADNIKIGHGLDPRDIQQRLEAKDQNRAIQASEVADLRLKRPKTEIGLKSLVVIINFIEFEKVNDDNQLVIERREGSERDEFIKHAFEERFECETMTMDLQNKDRTKSNYSAFISKVKERIRRSQFDLLFVIVSSHGGRDRHGQFFCDHNWDRIYVKEELKDCFSVDSCPAMEGKYAVFFVNACRSRIGDVAGQRPAAVAGQRSMEANYMLVHSCTPDSSSFRHSQYGSIVLLFFKQVLYEEGANLSIVDLLRLTQSRYLKDFRINQKDDYYQPRLEWTDTMEKDIFLMVKKTNPVIASR